jgi:benzoyl-CoA reductase/2-hydroxyglutaryl-CoA dehydratase subunit BcrC/BadD/HgdB
VPGDDPIGAIYAHNYKHVPNRSVYPAAVRLGWIYANAIRPEVQGVVIHMPRSDRSLGWDYPRLRDYLEQHDKPYLMMRDDASDDRGAASVTQAVSKFVARIQE